MPDQLALEMPETPQPRRAGYRLNQLELFNWGTFDKRVWRLSPSGETSLVTGDIGSGKSTLVDALTTLLLPSHKIAYNKAAGAETRERTLRSYVEGHYKSERIEATGTSRPVGLRDHTSYSVILGVFRNEGYDETVTIAQVFHQKDRAGQPDRFFVTSTKALSAETDFTDFGSDLAQLRRRLRDGGATISGSYPEYAQHVRRLLGIRSDQALELLHQTVSMKSVGNLNDFVRSHMLEPADAAGRVRTIVSHFEDLVKAHAAVRRAKEQLEALEPLIARAERYEDAVCRKEALEQQRDAIRLFFAELRMRLSVNEIQAHGTTRDTLTEQEQAAADAVGELALRREQLITQRAAEGGDRLAELDQEEHLAATQVTERRERHTRFAGHVTAAGLEPVTDQTRFAELSSYVRSQLETCRQERDTVLGKAVELAGRRRDLTAESKEIRDELDSLAGRRNNLPRELLLLRESLCDDLQVDATELPFAGELIDVADEFAQWRGAAERVLHGFALSLLVPQEHYGAVAHWVNGRRLTYQRGGQERGMRLVYQRVPQRQVRLQRPDGTEGLLLADTLTVAAGPFESYLHDQLLRRADHRCADSVEQFQSLHRAVTREGQVRSGDRHEKDDRSRVDDPRTWVLGWQNQRKVDALIEQLADLQRELLSLEEAERSTKESQDRLNARIDALGKLEEYRDWRELDWQEAQHRVDQAVAERERLKSGSSRLQEIERQLDEQAASAKAADRELQQIRSELTKTEERIDRVERKMAQDRSLLAAQSAETLEAARHTYAAIEQRLADTVPTRSDDCDGAVADASDALQHEITGTLGEINAHLPRVLGYMSDIRKRWPEATTEMDASIEAIGEFRAFRNRVAKDDLPAFEQEFKHQLNTNAIRELASFNNWLRRQSDEIGTRVDRINEALGAIDYTPGRYIKLVREQTPNQEIQAFRKELRDATNDALSADDDRYSEQRFLDVKRIIERFRGREGYADSDKNWTRRVTDVRNWFAFSASERDRETDTEWEHYRDSDGKSGGQKEKLAYTILAASLAYQFGLEWGVERSRHFHFAVIDEAFGRGSDVSTRYALELFKKLGLQLLIVTPLQKVRVIEPFVRSIGYVDNLTGSYSRVQTMTIEDFRERRDALGER